MAHAIRFHKTGGPEELAFEEVAVGEPGPGQARVRHTAIGVNYIDTYHRSGLYPLPLPSGLGNEAAGIVEAVRRGVPAVKVGDRVVFGHRTAAGGRHGHNDPCPLDIRSLIKSVIPPPSQTRVLSHPDTRVRVVSMRLQHLARQ